jgi:ABC-type transporter Mla MlaB component
VCEHALKLTATVRETPESIRVYLYGQFTDECLPELEKTFSVPCPDTHRVALDLSRVTFVDRASMKFLCGAKSRNISVENIPSYVSRWIEQEGSSRLGAFLPCGEVVRRSQFHERLRDIATSRVSCYGSIGIDSFTTCP